MDFALSSFPVKVPLSKKLRQWQPPSRSLLARKGCLHDIRASSIRGPIHRASTVPVLHAGHGRVPPPLRSLQPGPCHQDPPGQLQHLSTLTASGNLGCLIARLGTVTGVLEWPAETRDVIVVIKDFVHVYLAHDRSRAAHLCVAQDCSPKKHVTVVTRMPYAKQGGHDRCRGRPSLRQHAATCVAVRLVEGPEDVLAHNATCDLRDIGGIE